MGFIHENSIERQLLQQMNRFANSNEPICIEVDLLVVPGSNFAETREVYGKLVQQSTQRHCDQDLAPQLMK